MDKIIYGYFLFLLLEGVQVCFAAEPGFELQFPEDYTAFSGDIPVRINLPNATQLSRGVLEVRSAFDDTVITTLILPPGYTSGVLTLSCGVLDYEGVFNLRLLRREGGEVLVEKSMNVWWPRVQMTIPPQHETSSGEIVLQFSTTDDTSCTTRHDDVKFTLVVAKYLDQDDQSNYRPMTTIETSNFNDFKQNPISLACKVFDEAGYYKILFISSRQPLEPISESNEMDVTWSTDYAVSAIEKSIFPCEGEFSIQYNQPNCAGDKDKIRLFKQVKLVDSNIPNLLSEVYMEETTAVRGQWEASFDCGKFDVSDVGYCFKYISTARSGGTEEQDAICVDSVFTPVAAVDGNWGTWGEWSTCSNSCEDGKQYRNRFCDSPPPSGQGEDCAGSTLDWQLCGSICIPPSTQAPIVYTPAPLCKCGCSMATSTGTIVTSHECKGPSIWIISATKGYFITLTFKQYSLDPKNPITRVLVRDGASDQSDLLLADDGSHPPSKVETKHNAMWIEFMTPFAAEEFLYGGSQDEGFAATFVTKRHNDTAAGDSSRKSEWSLWETTMVIIGVLIVIIIIIAAVCFICYHRVSQKRLNKKLQQANQALLVNGEPPNSPVHSNSGSNVKGSTNLSFGDPVGNSPVKHSNKKRDYVVAKSEPTSPVNLDDVDINLKHSKHGSSARHHKDPKKHRMSKSLSNGLSSPTHRSVNATIHTPTKSQPQSQSPTYVNSSSQQVKDSQRDRGRKPLSPRNDSRNKSFISAIGRGPQAAPMAGEEELSPTTPTNPNYPFPAHAQHKPGEAIQMDSYYSNHPYAGNKQTAETCMFEERPPTEGRDSFTYKKSRENIHEPPVNSPTSHKPVLKSSPRHNTNYDPRLSQRPDIKPLPLRSIQRPDGQSPDQKIQPDADLCSPQSQLSSGLSPMLQKTQLFPSRAASQLDLPIDPDFEYDDSIYVSDLPGSYFNMDPGAYTLTWQQHPQYQGAKLDGSRTPSQQNIDSTKNGSFC